MGAVEQITALLGPAVSSAGLELYDVTLGGGVLRVLVTATGGVDLERIGSLTRTISRLLDEHDPISGRYTLEVSSPGLERALRTSAHFAGAVGETVRIKTLPDADLPRRLRGTLVEADERVLTIRVAADTEPDGSVEPGTEVRVPTRVVTAARTQFDWGPPSQGPRRGARPAEPRPRAGSRTRADRPSHPDQEKKAAS